VDRKGFTLIEIVLSISIVAVLGGVVALLSNSIIESWRYTQNRLQLQKASSEIMNELIQGSFEATGIRDATDFISCGAESISFLPLWVDETHKPDPVGNKEQKFTLNRHFKAGSSVPLAQVKAPGSADWQTVQVKFTYGEKNEAGFFDDVAQVLDPIPRGAKLKFTFTPDPAADINTQKSFVWNKESRRIYFSYKGETKDLIRTMPDVKAESLRFLYYDNLNQLIMPGANNLLSGEQIKRVTGVKVYLLLVKEGEWRESTSYTGVRNIQSTGVSVIEGSIIPVPASTRIKAFSMGNFFGRKRDGIIRLVIRPKDTKEWALQLKVSSDKTNPERMKVEKFQIESPPGRLLASGFVEQSFMLSEFVNLLVLDRTGLYDYDDDDGVKDFYISTEEPAFLEVERLDFDGASLFVRP